MLPQPKGPFAEVVKEEARVFFLHAPGHAGFITESEICDVLTDVAWEFSSDATGLISCVRMSSIRECGQVMQILFKQENTACDCKVPSWRMKM